MGQGNTVAFKARCVKARQQNQQRRTGADDKGVEEHAERLHHALCDRVLNVCHGGHVRGAAQACFVGEYATFDAHHNRAADQAAKHRVHAEGTFDDVAEHGWHLVKLQHDHVQGHGDVGEGFDRHQQVGHRGDAFDTADEHQAQQHGDGKPGVVDLEPERVLQRVRHGVGLQAHEGKSEGDQQQNCHQFTHPRFAQPVLHIEGRTAAQLAFGIAAFVQLAQRAFDQAAGHADQRGHPHPEHGAGAAEGHGNADAGDVARAHAARQAQHQCLKRAQLTGAAAQAVFEHRKHVQEVTKLNETRADREVATEPNHEHD